MRKAGITVCCGGILGMGESDEDRIGLLHQLATMSPIRKACPSTCWSGLKERLWAGKLNLILQ